MIPQNQHGDLIPANNLPVAAPMADRAFHVLELLASREEGYRLSELAQMLAMSRGSMHGLLKTMQLRGVVEMDGYHHYLLGPRIYDLAQAYIRRGGLRRFALPAMRRLGAQTGQTVCLGQLESDGVRIVDIVEMSSEQTTLRVSARRGAHVQLLAGALGRVVLASWPPARRDDYLRAHALPHFTDRSITDREAFLAAVAETARTGVGKEYGEYLVGVNAVAAGIQGLGGELIALMWIVGFSTRFTDAALQQAGEALCDETERISRALLGAG